MTITTGIRVAVVGAGSWGTTVASLCATNTSTMLWARQPDLAGSINQSHRNQFYLPEIVLHQTLRASADLAEVVGGADLVLMAVPSHGFRDVLQQATPFLGAGVPIVSLAKGLERKTLLRMSEVIREVAPGHPVAVITGPNLAAEIAVGQPAACVVAIDGSDIAAQLKEVLASATLRVYTNSDVVGCEIAGAVKNVIAIAAGMASGMGFGDNSRAALITRGLAEMTRLAMAMGGEALTLSGLAGMGDLIATCSSMKSRNTTVGVRLGHGESLDDILSSMSMVAEGVKSSPSVLELAKRNGVDMPITEQVVAVCRDGATANEALTALMSRTSKSEIL
ncbi:MAG: NAD(P)-dependent glycerol-3-phosphate dehydrogenase [Ilumatobacteraceae bacterium]|nr:NAD(P)-dependent glycerol-3-phosphate dehydrogenase [Ilumatobacteraceae bacterium]